MAGAKMTQGGRAAANLVPRASCPCPSTAWKAVVRNSCGAQRYWQIVLPGAATVRNPLNWREHSGSRLQSPDSYTSKLKVHPAICMKINAHDKMSLIGIAGSVHLRVHGCDPRSALQSGKLTPRCVEAPHPNAGTFVSLGIALCWVPRFLSVRLISTNAAVQRVYSLAKFREFNVTGNSTSGIGRKHATP